MEIYVVKEGDSLDTIAAQFSISPQTIAYDNQIPYPYRLAVGEALYVQNGQSDSQRRAVYVGGYAYPFIRPWVLAQTLPALSYLYVFSYGFTAEGNLIPPLVDDTWMIEAARQAAAAPVLTLTPFGEDGMFNNYLITQVVENLQARRNLKDQIVSQILNRGFGGLDIDFEFIRAEDREAFVDFTAYMKESIGALGYPVSVALAPKTSDDQPGLLYEGKDYAGLAQAADYVLLMTYEWGYTYGPAMAVAPLNLVRRVVEYALTKMEPEKIHLGIPNYGYDWTLPYLRGESKAVTIGNVEAVQIAIENQAVIQFDDVAQSPFFRYEKDGLEHEVWFEDARSMRQKFNLIEEYQLRGCSYWQVMQLFRANWLLLEEMFDVNKIE